MNNEDIKKAEWQCNLSLHMYAALQRIGACSYCLSVHVQDRTSHGQGGVGVGHFGGDVEVGGVVLQVFNSSRMQPLACVKSDWTALSDKLVSAAKSPLRWSKTDRIWTFC